MSALTPHRKRLIAAAVAVEVPVALLAWRNLKQREDDQVRGPKALWRVLIALNPGNALLYWLLGRR